MNWLRQLIPSIVRRYFSKKITVAFLPPPPKNEEELKCVSLNRLRYCSANFCKHHAKKLQIKGNEYVGLAIFNQQIIQELPDRYRLVFNLYVVDGFSHKQIGEML